MAPKKSKKSSVKNDSVSRYGVPVPDPEFPEPGSVADRDLPAPQNYYPFEHDQIIFLQEVAKDLDYDRARKVVDWNKRKVQTFLANPSVKQELAAIFDAWKKTIYMTGEMGAGRFLKILDKMEASFDNGNTEVANAVARMAGDYLKATGHFDKDGGSNIPQVSININLGDGEEKMKNVTIDAQQEN